MPKLHLDLETYSEVDLPSSGVYPYAQHPSTEILMLAWALDNQPVQLITDLTKLPIKLRKALNDPKVTLCAFEANFERIMLREVAKIDLPIQRWRCTMIHGLGLSFSGGLAAQAAATAIQQQKMVEGRRLILKFSKPQPPSRKVLRWTKDNAPEDWDLFKNTVCRTLRQNARCKSSSINILFILKYGKIGILTRSSTTEGYLSIRSWSLPPWNWLTVPRRRS